MLPPSWVPFPFRQPKLQSSNVGQYRNILCFKAPQAACLWPFQCTVPYHFPQRCGAQQLMSVAPPVILPELQLKLWPQFSWSALPVCTRHRCPHPLFLPGAILLLLPSPYVFGLQDPAAKSLSAIPQHKKTRPNQNLFRKRCLLRQSPPTDKFERVHRITPSPDVLSWCHCEGEFRSS